MARAVIVGGGFGGLAAARVLGRSALEVLLLDRENYHVFQPLLYQVASAALAPSDIAVPIRWLLRRQGNTRVLMAAVQEVAPVRRTVVLDTGQELGYDYLILAAGARHAYFGHDEWERLAPGLKTLSDAVELRHRFLLAFERAEACSDPVERESLLSIVIVGGGPTGVELAGIMASVARRALPRDFRVVDTRLARIVLVEAGPRLLPSFQERLSQRALRDLAALGVQVRLSSPVTMVDEEGVLLGSERIRAKTVFWAAGNRASRLGSWLGVPLERNGQLRVLPDLSVLGWPEIFVVGDMALVSSPAGGAVPGVAQGAIQMGRTAARNILRDFEGRPRQHFRYRNLGDLAVIGRYRAVAQFPFASFTGFPAWLLWLFVHILRLAGFRNRASVLLQWGYSFATWQRGVRLILRKR
jgi:NADH dehydrogenase